MERLKGIGQMAEMSGLSFATLKAAHDHIVAFLHHPHFDPANFSAMQAVRLSLLSPEPTSIRGFEGSERYRVRGCRGYAD